MVNAEFFRYIRCRDYHQFLTEILYLLVTLGEQLMNERTLGKQWVKHKWFAFLNNFAGQTLRSQSRQEAALLSVTDI
jgi:hypothetical protein